MDNKLQFTIEVDAKTGIARVKEFGDQAEKTAKSGEKNFLGMDLSLRNVVGSLGLAGIGMKAFGEISAALDQADQMSKLSKTTGIAVEEISALKYAADLSGVSLEQTTQGINIMSRNMADAARGTGEAKDAFDALGISIKEQDGNLRNSNDVLMDVADKFARLPDGPQKAALAMDIFGRSGAALIPLLNDGSAGLRSMREEAERAGRIISGETAEAAERLNDNLDRLKGVILGSANVLMTAYVPALDAAASHLLRLTGLAGNFAKFKLEQDLEYAERERERIEQGFELTETGELLHSGVYGAKAEQRIRELDGQIKNLKGSLAAIQKEEEMPALKKSKEPPLELNLVDKEKQKKEKAEYEKFSKELADLRMREYEEIGKAEEQAWAHTYEGDERLRQWQAKEDKELFEQRLKGYEDLGEEEERAMMASTRSLKAYTRDFKNEMGEQSEFAKQSAHNMQDSMSGLFFDVLDRNMDNASDYWKAFWTSMKHVMANSLSEMALEWGASELKSLLTSGGSGSITDAILKGIGGGIGAITESAGDVWDWAMDLFHAGGTVGMASGKGRELRPGEYGAVLLENERVLSPEESVIWDRLFGGGAAGPGVAGQQASSMADAVSLGIVGQGFANAAQGFVATLTGFSKGEHGGYQPSVLGLLGLPSGLAQPGKSAVEAIIGQFLGAVFGGGHGAGASGLFGGTEGPEAGIEAGIAVGYGGGAASGGDAGGFGPGGFGLGGFGTYAKGTGLAGLPTTGEFYGHASEIILDPMQSGLLRALAGSLSHAAIPAATPAGGASMPINLVIELENVVDGDRISRSVFKRAWAASSSGELKIKAKAVDGFITTAGLAK